MRSTLRLTIVAVLGWAISNLSTVTVQAQFSYAINNGTITITGYNGPGGDVTIPNTINGRPVTSIKEVAFSGCTSLVSVIIPDSVIDIGRAAFTHCTGLTSVTIGNGVTSIGGDAFSSCTSLTNMILPDSVTSIGVFAFAWCTSLMAIDVNPLNLAYSSLNGVLFDKNQAELIQYPGGKTGAYIIPGSVTSIGEGAFHGCGCPQPSTNSPPPSSACRRLTAVTIPDSVTNIGVWAFAFCRDLTSVTIPDSVTSIDREAFTGCAGLTNLTIGNGVISIGSQSFHGCRGLTSITIPDSVTSIRDGAFYNCTGLASVTIGNSVTSIGGGRSLAAPA